MFLICLELSDLLKQKHFLKFDAIVSLQPHTITLKNKDNFTLLHLAIYHHAPVTSLEHLHQLINQRTKGKNLPIRDAAHYYHIEAVKWLLSIDVNLINDRGNRGRTPLHYACLNNDKAIVEYLLSFKQIDINVKDNFGDIAEELLSCSYKVTQMLKDHRRKHSHW